MLYVVGVLALLALGFYLAVVVFQVLRGLGPILVDLVEIGWLLLRRRMRRGG